MSFPRYDDVAASFNRYRAPPEGIPEAVRSAVLDAVGEPSRPRLLDLGAGAGRIGRAFVDADDDYCGVDLSLEMLRQFDRQQEDRDRPAPRLVQSDGEHLPFADATFDAVMLMQVIGAARDWKLLLTEARRVLRNSGALIVGHTTMPDDSLDERMKQELASLLGRMGIAQYHINLRKTVQQRLDDFVGSEERVVAAVWNLKRTPRAFLDRQRTGARFSAMPEPVKELALSQLSTWAAKTFSSLDTVFAEEHSFELQIFRFNASAGG